MSEALADPRAALTNGEDLLATLPESEFRERSEVLRAMSMAARHAREVDTSVELARQAAEVAEMGGHTTLRLMGLLTMSGSLDIAGRTTESLLVIDQGIADAPDDHLKARFVFQRGAVLDNAGKLQEALNAFNQALPVFRAANDEFSIGLALNRMGWAYIALGRLTEAEECLKEALELALDRQERAAAHGIMHNLGLLASYRGDIPEALDWLEKSDDLYMEVSGADAPQHVARAEVLISAGRFAEALESARQIAESAGTRGDTEHESNALLVGARAALMSGRYDEAIERADAAAAIYERDSIADRRVEARALAVEARFAAKGGSARLLDQAEDVVERLSAEGVVVGTAQARFTSARIAAAVGKRDLARSQLRQVAAVTTGPVESQLQSALARALLAELEGRSGDAARAAAYGLRLIDEYQATLAATELRLGIERHGGELAEIGLRHALESGRPRRVLRWLDRTRARALRVRPVTPSGSDEVSESLADLRRIMAELRNPESRKDPALIRRQLQLERTIARAERVRRREGREPGDLPTDDVVEALEDRQLYEMGVVDGRLIAVLARNGRAKVVEVGDMERVAAELNHLRFAMRRAARRQRPLDASAFDSISAGLLGGLRLGDGPVLVVPPPSLMSVPWAAIPALRGRQLVVAPSAQMWWRARRSVPATDGVVVAGGPDLEVARQEVRRVGRIHEGATVLPPGVGVEVVKKDIEGAAVAHIACHATFSVENPMFSSLRLGDGDLNVYDIERLGQPPSLVVLSACDSGYTEARTGDELAGLTSALLSMGTRTVIASVGLVPDSPATSDLMVDFHKGLVAGLEPAAALAVAQEKAFEDQERFVSAASFICVGA